MDGSDNNDIILKWRDVYHVEEIKSQDEIDWDVGEPSLTPEDDRDNHEQRVAVVSCESFKFHAMSVEVESLIMVCKYEANKDTVDLD